MKIDRRIALMIATGFAAGWTSVAYSQDTASAEEPAAEEIIVTGMRESLKTSLDIKRNTMEIVDSITAEDIGKLPDPNVSETLTRIPGVQGYRYGGEGASPVGEGSGLTIRGLSGQTASRVDGRAYFTAGGREFNIESAIPGMIAGVDVYKNPSAEHIEGGIGGLVNLKTRRPLDFKGLTLSAAVSARYNDLTETVKPEIFGLFADRWSAGDGEMGLMIAANYQESHNRSDSNPANGGTSLRRAIRADSAEYATTPGANQAYAGRSDVWHLADATCTAAPCNDLITALTQNANVFQEDIRRVRKGLNAAFQWRPNPDLEFYAEGNYNYYRYHQQYRFLIPSDSRTVQNLVTEPYTLDEAFANRNSNGGSNDILAGQRLASGTFLGSSLTLTGGNESRPYETWIAATGVKWQAIDRLHMKLDLSYVKADQTQDNRSVNLVPRAGLTWDISRDLTTTPHEIAFSGPSLSDPANFVFRDYNNGVNQSWDDDGWAAQYDLKYDFDTAFLTDIKAGVRYATQSSRYRNYSFNGRPLTTDGLALAANQSNAISAGQMPELVAGSPTNWLDGKAGYKGGYLVFDPEALLGDNVRENFPLAGIPADGSLPENVALRRFSRERTYAGYVMADFAALDDRIKGNAGVRVVKTDLFARAGDASEAESSYTEVLPSFNITGYLTPETLLRFGYAKAITRAPLGDLNPALTFSQQAGTGAAGNPDLRPTKADSFDLSLEHYFSDTNYVSAGLFYKDISGFINRLPECLTITGAPAPTAPQCDNPAQYLVTRPINAGDGYAKGMELAFQSFFDFLPGALSNFGASGSYTYLKTKNVIAINGQLVDTPMPFQSKHNWSLSGLYEDDFVSARVVYTYRSDFVLFGVAANPVDGRYVKGYGILDASINFNLPHGFTFSLNASNLTNQGPNRYVGEPGSLASDFERQHFVNGRSFGIGLRYKFGE